MVWRTKLGPSGPRPRRRVRELARDLEMPVKQVIAILHELGEYVSSSTAFVEEPVVARVHAHCGRAYEPKATPRVSAWSTGDAAASKVGPPPPRRRPTDLWQRHAAADERDRWAAGLGQDVSDAFAYEGWKLFGFSAAERDVWIDAGLRPGQVKTAVALREAGLKPDDLQKNVNGWTVLDRVTKGEGAKAVARLLDAAS